MVTEVPSTDQWANYRADYSATWPPKASRGGTFYYCHQPVIIERRVPKLDKLGRKTRYTTIETEVIPDCGQRFRIANGPAAILRHARRNHA
jgi:hypothetical protein